MIAVDINEVAIKSPPAIDARDKKSPWGVPAAVNEVITSGAPFPNASRVTPAKVSENLSFWEMYWREFTRN